MKLFVCLFTLCIISHMCYCCNTNFDSFENNDEDESANSFETNDESTNSTKTPDFVHVTVSYLPTEPEPTESCKESKWRFKLTRNTCSRSAITSRLKWPPGTPRSRRIITCDDKYPEALNFNAGDIIVCQHYRSSIPHTFLASGNLTVIYAEEPRYFQVKTKTRIIEEKFYTKTRNQYKCCNVKTLSYDFEYDRYFACNRTGAYSDAEAVNQAKFSVIKHKGNLTSYDSTHCNSEHWVTSWKYGFAWSRNLRYFRLESIFYKTSDKFPNCEAPGLKNCHVN